MHFFPKLRFIAFNYTRNTMQRLCSPGNGAYDRSEHAVVQAAARPHGHGNERRRVPWFEYAAAAAGGELARSAVQGRNLSYKRKRDDGSVKKGFEKIMKRATVLLEEACGGRASEDGKALPKCSWEGSMKSYILTFP